MSMGKKELSKRYILFIIGLFFSAIGVAFSKHAGLGVSPISSVANILSCKFTFLSLGTWLIIWNCTMILGQVILLGKNFQLFQFLQVPLSVLFGWFTDFGMLFVSKIPIHSYLNSILILLIGIVIMAFGISLSVSANVILNAGKAFVKSIAETLHKEFGNVKICFDLSCVTFSIVMSLIFFDCKLVGIREGTILSAMLTGHVVKFFTKKLKGLKQ